MLDNQVRPNAPTAPEPGAGAAAAPATPPTMAAGTEPPPPTMAAGTEPRPAGSNPQVTVRLLLALANLLLLGVLIADLSDLLPVGDYQKQVGGIAALALAVSLYFHARLSAFLPTRSSCPRPWNDGAVNLASIRAQYADLTARYTLEQINLYARLILYPGEARARIVEEITPQKRTLQQKLTTAVTVPKGSGPDRVMLFPALIAVKGDLQDSLAVSLDDSPAAMLTHREYLALTCLVLETLLVPRPSLPAADAARLAGYADTALRLVARRGRLDDAGLRMAAECADRIAELAEAAGHSLLMASALVRKLANCYAIVVAIPQSARRTQRQTLVVSRDVIPDLRIAPRSAPLRALRDRIGALLSARPVQVFNVRVSNAAVADSYHLYVHGPEGMYVSRHAMSGMAVFAGPNDGEDLTRPYARFQHRRGQRYLHLYMRSIPERLAERLFVNVRFAEVPPGSMAGATLAAGASFVLIYLAALILSNSTSSAPALGSDFPALVLAFPAVAGALVGYDNRGSGLVGGTLSAQASSFVTVLVSLGASGMFMAREANIPWSGGSAALPGVKSVLGVHGVWWQLLTVVALLNVSYALYVWVTRTASFYWLANRRAEGD